MPFRYRNRGALAVIGRGRAIADFGRVQLTGRVAWWTWLLVHLLFGLACWIMGRLSLRAWPSDKATPRQHVLIWFILFAGAADFSNLQLDVGRNDYFGTRGSTCADIATSPLWQPRES